MRPGLLALLFGVAALAGCAPVSAESGSAVVLRVVDGDTLDVLDDGRGRLRVRVLGINTPETKPPAQCWGAEATEFAEATLLNKRVVLVGDPSQDARDRYGRTLAYVQVDGQDYSVLSVAAGAGRAYVFDRGNPPARAGDIAAAEAAARASSQGLWGAPCFAHTG